MHTDLIYNVIIYTHTYPFRFVVFIVPIHLSLEFWTSLSDQHLQLSLYNPIEKKNSFTFETIWKITLSQFQAVVTYTSLLHSHRHTHYFCSRLNWINDNPIIENKSNKFHWTCGNRCKSIQMSVLLHACAQLECTVNGYHKAHIVHTIHIVYLDVLK